MPNDIFGQEIKPKRKKRDNSKSNDMARYIVTHIRELGGFACRIQKGVIPTGKTFRPVGMPNGLPDVLACIQGKYIAIEIKIGNDKMSEEQEYRKKDIEGAGGVWIIAREFNQFQNDLLNVI